MMETTPNCGVAGRAEVAADGDWARTVGGFITSTKIGATKAAATEVANAALIAKFSLCIVWVVTVASCYA